MSARASLLALLAAVGLAACSSSSNAPRATPAPPATNSDGSLVTAVITARFDPSAGVVPFPSNLLLSGTRDLTLNIPGESPTNPADPVRALNALDGFSTVAPWVTTFSAAPAPASIVAGTTVRMFEVTLTGPGGAVTGVVRELTAGQEFATALSPSDTTGRTLAIIPTRPLKQLTSYMVVLTNGIRDARGNDATPDQAYFLAKRTSPLCVGGQSTEPLLPASTACALEPLRQLVNAQEAAAAARGIPRERIVLSWVATTQGITPVLQAVRSTVEPRATQLARTGQTTAIAGLPPVADIWIGVISLPYYLEVPTAANPTAVLTGRWRARPGAYVPPFNQAGLDPTSDNITFANPLPVRNAELLVPVLLTVPNANSGRTRPAAGWPVVIFQHGITRNRTDAIGIAATMAAQGFAVVAIDQPLHGLPPTDPLAIRNTPFAQLGARERTFDVDLINNQTGAPGPDGVPDPSGAHTINLSSLLTSRDNLRQAVADLFHLAASVPRMDITGDGIGDFDGARVAFVGQSLGAMVGTPFLALEPTVTVGVLNVPGGGIARLLDGSPTFGPRIRAGLQGAGIQPGTPDFDRFMVAAQTVVDSADPINYGIASVNNRILLQAVVGNPAANVPPDQVVPNTVAGAPLSGTEPLIAALGLSPITQSASAADGIRGAVRFIAGDHGSLLSPAASPAATAEMQGQMASMIVSGGVAVQVANASVIRTQ
ncbi:MAG: Ig-like domain-containing protein [Xanthomonadales bacterium]|nr:Ig-like domain-containing protein [Xanthomonadales bacterium]